VRLNVNPKNGEQVVRGTANLPAGLGKSVKIAVFCSNDEYDDLKKQGLEIDYHIKDTNAQ
jgi:large subunit ribosomal protein L1